MEQLCDVTIQIGGYRPERREALRRACAVEWAFREEDFSDCPADDGAKLLLQASALGSLYGGETAADVIERLERAVWRANGEMCHVDVEAECFGGAQGESVFQSEYEHEMQDA